MLMGKRAASWALHFQGRLQKLTTPIKFMTSRTRGARERMDQHGQLLLEINFICAFEQRLFDSKQVGARQPGSTVGFV